MPPVNSMTTPEQMAEKIAEKIVEKSRKRWIEETDEGFGCNLDILGKDMEYEMAAALRFYGEACVRKAVIESFGPEYRKIRKEALEEAAKMFEKALDSEEGMDFPHERLYSVVEQIRALLKEHQK